MYFTSYILAQATQVAQETSLVTALQDFMQRGGAFMWPILACLIFGLGLSFVKFYSLMRSGINAKKFLLLVTTTLAEKGVDEAINICQNTHGPIASVFHAGLLRADEGVDAAEKAILTYGAIEMGFLERGLIWISLFISIAPMLGFTGTVQGMIMAFDDIAATNTMSPAIIATGISVALLTTLFGLVVAMLLQVFYNFFIARIDKLVADMEESSIELIDALYNYKKNKK